METHRRDCACRCHDGRVSWTGLGFAISGSFNVLFIMGSAIAAAVIFGA